MPATAPKTTPTIDVGQKAPSFTNLPSTAGKPLSLADYQGKTLVLYFYPKDDTPGCTTEGKEFSAAQSAFTAAGAVVIGVSKDSIASHQKFCQKHALSIDLISDEDGSLCEAYGTWVEKSMYGKKYMGIDRATFIIDKEGTLRQIWRSVKVTGHVDAVLKAVQQL